jgi:pimeloyl-ACP methyl ester carboxylesterase
MSPNNAPFVSRFSSAPDGLRLHLRDYGSASDPGTPVVCIAGLTRNSADFDPLARALADGAAGGRRRRVLALDYRGRGLSDWDKDWRNYDVKVENADILAQLTAAGIDEAVVVGTSRGGIHAMVLGATRPAMLRGVVLNDVGPALESKGMARIKAIVGKLPSPASFDDAVDQMKRMNSALFSGLSEEEWRHFTRTSFRDTDGRLGMTYDPQLMRTLDALDVDKPLPTMWPFFEGLANVPTLVLRGANSDLLSAETTREMCARHKNCTEFVVPGQGHAPLIADQPTIARVGAFVAACDK